MNNMITEPEVLVFPKEIFGPVYSLIPWAELQSHIEEIERCYSWLSRPRAEVSHEMVQAIPCVIIRDSSSRCCVFRRVRENRNDLNKKLSLVIGGHIDDSSNGDSFQDVMLANLAREIEEEIGICPEIPPRPIGVIIDGSSIVASRHVAFLHEISAEHVTPQAPEEFTKKSKFTGEFMSPSQLSGLSGQFDPWSRLVIEEYLCPSQVSRKPRQGSFL